MVRPEASPRLSILVVHSELPLHDRNSGSLRLRRLLELMVAEGHRVTFLARAGIGQETYAEELRDLGIEVHAVDAARLRAEGYAVPGVGIDLPLLLRRGRFDLAWLSFYETAERYLPEIRAHAPLTRVVIDTVDVHHLRERRGAELAGDAEALAAAERTRERETTVYTAADALVAVSEDDARELRAMAPDTPVHVVSNVHAPAPPGPGFDERGGLVFVGNFAHAPNADAILHFHATAWPVIREALPDLRLSIVGTQPPAEVRALAGPGVEVTGWVPDVAPYLHAARVSIAPLRYGAGVKGKVGEALGLGLPVVASTIAAEGMGLRDGEELLVADDPAAFAAATVRLHSERALWERLSQAGAAAIDRLLSPAAATDALRGLFADAAPTCRVARIAGDDRAALRSVLADHLAAAHGELVLPADLDAGAEPETVLRDTASVLEELGTDPEHAPDITILPTRGKPVVPSSAAIVGAPPPANDDAPLASIVICAHGKRDYTERCLRSLDAALGARLGGEIELVLVDNASPDDTADLFAAWADRARVVALPENRNFAGGNNAGAAVARGRVLVLLNNDTEVGPGVLEALVEEALRPGVGAVGLRLTYPDGRIQHGGFGWRAGAGGVAPFHMFHFEDAELAAARASFDTQAVTGACVAVAREHFDLVGGFDEAFVNGWEDTDLCFRLRSAGLRVRYRGDLAIVHHEGITSGARYDSAGNAERFHARWGPALEGDDPLVRGVLGGAFVGALGPRAADDPTGAPALVTGPVAGLGAAADEARALVRTLGAAARTVAPTWIGPDLPEGDAEALLAAHRRAARPDAAVLCVPDAGAPAPAAGDGLVLRLANVPAERPEGATAWAATSALADELVAAGWPAEAVLHVPPCGIDAACGPGGEGLLVLLPIDPTLADKTLAALPDAGARIVPVARTAELAAAVAARAPRAELLAPVTNESALARLCAGADVVLAADPDDLFDRRALVAAAAGAAVVVRPDGPAAEVLGEFAHPVAGPDGLAAALAAARHDTTPRTARAARVVAACGPEATPRLCALLGLEVAGPPGRPDLGDFAWAPAFAGERAAAGGPRISAVINTLDEERNLRDALRSVAWVDEIVVVDMHSEDATRAIAEEHGARVYLHERAGIVEPARNFALAQATGDWILCLDADERIPEKLARRLDAVARRDDVDVVDVPFRNWLCGRWMEATGWGGGDWHLRFFRRGAVAWSDRVHAVPEISGRRGRLPADDGGAILHLNYDDLAQFVAKTNRYTDKEADAVAQAPTRSWADVVTTARAEVRDRWSPERDGTQSVALSMAMLFYRFLAGAKQWERHGFPDVGAPTTARDALRDLAGDGRLAYAAGVEAFGRGDGDAALGHLLGALRAEVDPELLNDLAVACHVAGDAESAAALLRVCLIVAPDHAAARANLADLRPSAGGALAA